MLTLLSIELFVKMNQSLNVKAFGAILKMLDLGFSLKLNS
jgi:hypothetical protein